LRRIGLEGASLGSPSFDTLQTLVLEHQLHIPYDTTSLHVPDWRDDAPISFGRGQGMQLGVRNFQRIVLGHQGGFCFALNSLFAALLRSLGFRVSGDGQIFWGVKTTRKSGTNGARSITWSCSSTTVAPAQDGSST
jgi:arylamine N-acetyltransferase